MLNSTELLASLEWRYAAKTFDPQKKISSTDWQALERALVLTPSSYGLQPWKFLVVQDPAVRQKLQAASWNQRQVTEASHFVVFAHRISINEEYIDHYLQSIATTRGIPVETLAGFRKGIVGDVINGVRSKIIPEWSGRQAYIALGNFMTSAATMRVDTCPLEGLDPVRYDEILNLQGTEYRALVACAAGYRNAADSLATAKKVRFPLADMVQPI